MREKFRAGADSTVLFMLEHFTILKKLQNVLIVFVFFISVVPHKDNIICLYRG